MQSYRTARLLLRRWRDEDRAPCAELCADPMVMEHFPARLTRVESDAMIDRIEAHFEQHGFGLWALEAIDGPSFLGFTGLLRVTFDAAFTPAVELGWRLARSAWGQGFATEAARLACRIAFTELGLSALVAFTVPANKRSRAVMQRLGMTHDPADDFDHPRLAPEHPLRRHVLYRLSAPSVATP